MRSFLHLLQRLQQQLKRSQKYGRYQLDALQLAGCVPVILFLELVLVPSRAKKMGAAKSRDYRFSDIFLLPSCSRELLAPLLFLFFFLFISTSFFFPWQAVILSISSLSFHSACVCEGEWRARVCVS